MYTPSNREEWTETSNGLLLPDWVRIMSVGSKGKEGDPRAGPRILQLRRNKIEHRQEYCVITAFYEFYALIGMFTLLIEMLQRPAHQRHYIPMFPHYNEDDRSFDLSKPATTSWMQKQVRAVLRKCHWLPEDNIGPEGVTVHALRAAAAVWALRCGAHDTQVRLCGRWSQGSAAFDRYAQQVTVTAETLRFQGKEDPIYGLFCWHSSYIGEAPDYQRRPPPPGAVYSTARAAGSD